MNSGLRPAGTRSRATTRAIGNLPRVTASPSTGPRAAIRPRPAQRRGTTIPDTAVREPRAPYPDQPGYGAPYGRPEYGQPDYGQPGYGPQGGPQGDYRGYEQGGYPPPVAPAAAEYDYSQQGYAPGGDYAAAGQSVTLQLDDGSGRTYQLREGANVIGRGQDAQFASSTPGSRAGTWRSAGTVRSPC